MKGDFSRKTFDSRKHYSGVLMQQGRVQLDADWNEQGAIQRRRTQVEARDVIGRCGAPRDDSGFEVGIAANKLTIGAGRYYVGGLLAENETAALAYEAQPDLLDPPSWTDALAKASTNLGLVYLDVWERHITALDDPLLREVALGGPDTATRIKTVWQLRVLPLNATGDAAQLKKLQAQRDKLQQKLDALIEAGGEAEAVGLLQSQIAELDGKIAELGELPGCEDQFTEWDGLVANPDRRLNARSQPPTNVDGPCIVPPTAGYRRLENQLYRVEVHKAGPRATATFKWSRDNGTVVTAIEKIGGKDVIVHDLGPDEVLGFAAGQWVELSDDALELAGLPGQLVQIDTVNATQRKVSLLSAPTPLAAGATGVDPDRHPKLRRWDQKAGAGVTADGVAMAAGWMPLEDGVEVQFSNGTFRSGDYWVIPARTATGELEWPPFEIANTAPEAQPPRGIEHHYCRLALVAFDAETKEWAVVDDCRSIFPPLTECCDERATATHVTETNWRNDDAFDTRVLVKDGLRIRLDQPPDPLSLTNETVVVWVEMPAGSGETANRNQVHRVYFKGSVTRDPADEHVIVWRLIAPDTDPDVRPARAVRRLRARAEAVAEDVISGAATRATAVSLALRVHVEVKGSWVWADGSHDGAEPLYLDGRALGRPGTRTDGTPRIALAFPSGIDAGATDFESWFLAGQRQQPTGFRVTTVRFLNSDDQSSSAGDIDLPRISSEPVHFGTEDIRLVQIGFSEPFLEQTLGAGEEARIFVEEVDVRDRRRRLFGEIHPESDTVVRLVLRDPPIFGIGDYVLTCVGTNADGAPGGILSAQEVPLDGDYDDKPGGNLELPFAVG